MTKAYTNKYGAAEFNASKRSDKLGEMARQMVIESAIACEDRINLETEDDVNSWIGGLMIGIVQVMQSALIDCDESDAEVRATIIKHAPWAVDASRAMVGKDPLPSA